MNELGHKDYNFDEIRKFDTNGNEYWLGRELGILMEYESWQSFERVLSRAITSFKNSPPQSV